MKLKVCGMKYVENIKQVANLQPDYLGFIFYEKSQRNFEGIIPELPKSIKKTGVFVNELPEIVVSFIEEYHLEAIQLHGDETVEYIINLKKYIADAIFETNNQKKKSKHWKPLKEVEIIKVFSIKDEFDFSGLETYLPFVDYFLFDTKGKERGGNGTTFNWSVLEDYPFEKPFFLSGGIGLESVLAVKELLNTTLPIYALDVNSKFEESPGVKKLEDLKKFKSNVI
ncbi:phosphoribosylanthranilate isomerase [Polaribacter tangerinus]|uniref:phosphoribosylanthranilate isomerase n=1 Tax=Polaribacter tangerinus TaxID=1920034 RepID=UPI001E5F170A|nr:phosphoribosylanthranilate isomerase [Polaribacter tangerinus]